MWVTYLDRNLHLIQGVYELDYVKPLAVLPTSQYFLPVKTTPRCMASLFRRLEGHRVVIGDRS